MGSVGAEDSGSASRAASKARIAMMKIFLLLEACVLVACATHAQRAPSQNPTLDQLAKAEARLHRLEAELHSPPAGGSVDCSRAFRLVANICNSAVDVCFIATTIDYTDDRLESRCHDADARCLQARQDTAAHCPPMQRPAADT
jgi:hypothetical protein